MRILLILFFATLLLPNTLEACFCAKAEIDDIDFKYYEEIFLGEIKTINRVEFPLSKDLTATGEEIIFEVEKKWKGNNSKFEKIYQVGNSCADLFSVSSYKWIILVTKKLIPIV